MSEKKMLGVHPLGTVEGGFHVFAKDGMMKPIHKYRLDRGVKMYMSGYAGNTQLFVIIDDKMNAVEIDHRESFDWSQEPNVEEHQYMLGGYFGHRHKVDESCRPISEKFGIGCYFADDEDLVSEEVIERSIKRAEFLDRLQEKVSEHEAKLNEADHKRCVKNYKYLTRIDEIKDWREQQRTAGKNLRAELKKNFPTTKFSVRYSSFSGGDAYDIDWEDGPTREQVDLVVKKFQTGQPDDYSMGDYWDEVESNFTRLYGGAKYIMTQRSISEEKVQEARKMLLEKCPELTDENVNTMRLPIKETCSRMYQDIDEAARSYAYDIDWQEKEEKKSAPNKPISEVNGSFAIIQYSEKSIVLTGDTKFVKDELKKLGGRFNPKLTCGAGWVFPKSKEEDVRKAVNL